MELDRTLMDNDGTPSAEELKEYFQRNDYTAFKPTYNPSRASQAQLKLYMKAKQGLTQKEIAERLGYKSHSAVTKRMEKMKKALIDFCADFNN